jgi:hypothetical protein
MLTLAAARLCGYAGDHHIRLAATVEFIHTATLLHDDVVDESQRRRGRPTANLLWDNKSSVLVGDYLFARSFQLMVETGSLRVLDILANASATIAEGEVLQLTAAQNLRRTEGDLPAGRARQDGGAVLRGDRGGRRDRRRARGSGGARCSPMATRWASPSRSPTTCWITAARMRPSARTPATISANAS